MKIVIVAHYFLPHKGGLEFVVYNQAKKLINQGHEVTIISSRTGDEPKEEIIEGINVKRVNVWNLFENKWGVPYPIYKIGILRIFGREIKTADLVYIHDLFYMPCYFGAFFANLYKKPIVLMEHIKNVRHSKWIVNLIQAIVMKTFGKYVLNSSKKIVICNTEVGNWLRKKFEIESKAIFIKNAVDTDLFRPATNEIEINLRRKHKLPLDKPIVLFAGRLYEVKGFDRLFESRDKKYLILFVGNGNVPEEMKKDPNVKFIGAVSQKELVEFYQLSDMFCLPSRNEGFPLSILESLSCGIPVISSNLPGYNKYVGSKDVKLIDASNIQNIKDSISEIIKNKTKYKKLQSYYRDKAVREFDWKVNVKSLLEVFNQAIKENETANKKTK